MLAQALADRGIEVEHGTELAGVHDGTDGVRAVLRSGGVVTEALFGFVAGCDGAASTVRSQAGIGWPGGPTRWRWCSRTPSSAATSSTMGLPRW